jgi:hypothetical protein
MSGHGVATRKSVFEADRSVVGTKLPIREVRNPVATGGTTDMARTAHFGRD